MKERVGAVVLAAGKGRRMGTETAKQFLELKGKPLIYYALKAFEDSRVDEVVLVTGKESVAYNHFLRYQRPCAVVDKNIINRRFAGKCL